MARLEVGTVESRAHGGRGRIPRECWVSWGCTFCVERKDDFRLVPKRWVCEKFELLGFFFEKARHQRFVKEHPHVSCPSFLHVVTTNGWVLTNLPSESRSNLFDVNDVESGRSSTVCVMRCCGHRENGGESPWDGSYLSPYTIYIYIYRPYDIYDTPYRPYDNP